jgi:hypothetical protein
MRALALVTAVAAILPNASFAEPVRPLRVGVGVGGYSAITGPADWGPAAEAEVYPGGSLGRLGFRVEARGFEAIDAGIVTAGVTYEVGASRPRLVLAIHADAGTSYGDDWRPVAGGGVHVNLFVLGPLGIGVDSTVMFVYDGVDSTLVLGTAGTLRLGF